MEETRTDIGKASWNWGKVSLSGRRQVLIRKFRANPPMNPRPKHEEGSQMEPEVVVKNGILMTSWEMVSWCPERWMVPRGSGPGHVSSCVADHPWAWLSRLWVQQPSPS